MNIVDTYGRSFQTLRVSLTNVCNFSCTYCVNGDVQDSLNKVNVSNRPLNHTQLAALVVRLHRVLKINSVRLTGGEPLLYPNVIPFLEILSHEGIKEVTMTTNGFLLKQKAKMLASAGILSLNVSLDSIDPAIFATISRRDGLQQVLEGIEEAKECGISVKLNAVIMRGINEQEILPLLDYSIKNEMTLRYLELMRMGHFYSSGFEKYYFPMDKIVNAISEKYRITNSYRLPSETAKYFYLENRHRFGIIANESEPFCSDCDRLRLDASGYIYGCLSENKREYIADAAFDETTLGERLSNALSHKQPLRFTGSPLEMIAIGG